MKNKIEVIKSYLDLLKIEKDFFFDEQKYEIKDNKRDNSYRCLAFNNNTKINNQNILVEKMETSLKVNVSNNLVTVHYVDEHRANINLGSIHNWMSLMSVKIAYFIIDNGNLVIMIGEENQCTLKDDLGNAKTQMRGITTLDDINNIKTYSIKVPEDFSLNSDISEYAKPYLKMKEYSLYKKI